MTEEKIEKPKRQVKKRTTKTANKELEETIEIDQLDRTLFNVEGKFLHIKVGKEDWDHDQLESEVSSVKAKVLELLEENDVNCLVLVTHCFVDIKTIEG